MGIKNVSAASAIVIVSILPGAGTISVKSTYAICASIKLSTSLMVPG